MGGARVNNWKPPHTVPILPTNAFNMGKVALLKKIRDNLGILAVVFILHFRPLGTYLVFTKKLTFCQYFDIYFWE